jgi:hypothetical protein
VKEERRKERESDRKEGRTRELIAWIKRNEYKAKVRKRK